MQIPDLIIESRFIRSLIFFIQKYLFYKKNLMHDTHLH
jgi:hypothetical protein